MAHAVKKFGKLLGIVFGGTALAAAAQFAPALSATASTTNVASASSAATPAKSADVGPSVIRRLTRIEYANAMRDLFGFDFDVASTLPEDPITNSFNNNGAALSMSPLLMEKYMSAARRVTRQALGDPSVLSTTDFIWASDRQTTWMKDVPLGSRKSFSAERYFPLAGTYEIRIYLGDQHYGFADLPFNEGQRLFKVRVKMPAGVHHLAVVRPDENAVPEGPIHNLSGPGGLIGGPMDAMLTLGVLPQLHVFIDGSEIKNFKVKGPTAAELTTPLANVPGPPFVEHVEIEGPLARVSEQSASRKRILICSPHSRTDDACAHRILVGFLRRAFRRDVDGQDVAPFMAIYRKQSEGKDFEQGVRTALQAALVSPNFLFRVESHTDSGAGASAVKVDDFELASRLSFLLWSSIPDDRLLALAHRHQLGRPQVLDAEFRRLLADPKANALVDNFGMQYLGLQPLDYTMPDKKAYPLFTENMRDEFKEESRLFLASIFLKNQSVLDIVGGSYTYLNADLAGHYGIPNVIGDQFRRVTLKPGEVRGGVLSQGSVSLVASHGNITSPVLRGKWVLTNLLALPPPNPPPGVVPSLQPTDASGKTLTGREQIEQHAKQPLCMSCHARMDPYGFSMENLDVTGRWRTRDEGGPVDAAVTMSDGSSFTGITGLKQKLLAKPDVLVQAFTERLFTYGLGRKVQRGDLPEIRKVVAQAAAGGYKFNDLLLGLINSPQFTMKKEESRS